MADPKYKVGDIITDKDVLFREPFFYKIREVVLIKRAWCYRLDCLERPIGVAALDSFSSYVASEVERIFKVKYNYNKMWREINVS